MSSFNCTKWGRWLPASHKSLRITTQFIELGNWKSQSLQLEKWSDVTSPPSLFHGWLLHTVRISLASNRSALLCFLGMKAARSAWLELSQGWYRPRIEATANVLSKFDSHIQNARYCRTSKWKSLTSNLQAWSEGLPSMPAEGVLADTQIEVLLSARALSKAPDAYLKRSREDYVAKALSENIDLFETVESMPLTAKQREACVIDDDNNLVLAGAGTGKAICSSKMFGVRQTELPPIREALAVYVSRAAEKLRAQNSLCSTIQVGLQTQLAQLVGPRYANAVTLALPAPTDDTREILSLAQRGLGQIYRPGYPFSKCSILLMDLSQRGEVTPDLFAPKPRPGSEQLMKVVDLINQREAPSVERCGRTSVKLPSFKCA